MIRVVAHLRREIERNAQPVDALLDEISVACVRLVRRGEARVLPHRPQTAAVHRRLDAAREREFAGKSELGVRAPPGEVVGRTHMPGTGHGADCNPTQADKVTVSA